jgi:hypothetical protein
MFSKSPHFSHSTLPEGRPTRVRQTIVFSPAITPLTENGVSYKVAQNLREHDGAFRLVYQAYVQSGLMNPNSARIRVTPHLLLPTTVTFVALRAAKVVSTLSLIGDGQCGLPMQCVYDQEVDALRCMGARLGEVSALASSAEASEADTEVVIALMRLMAQFSWRHGIERLLIAVHPKHARFYRRCLGFRVLGCERQYPSACDRPAVALQLDLSRLEQDFPSIHKFFFGQRIADQHLQASPMSEPVRRHFAAQVVRELDRSYSPEAALACA